MQFNSLKHFICTVYLPSRIQATCPENDEFYEYLQENIITFTTQGKVILMGDFNARTGIPNDYVELDNIGRPVNGLLPQSYSEDKVLPKRYNIDRNTNVQGQTLLDLCIESKLRMLNGRIMGDSLGYNTYYGPRGSSCIDYIIAAEELFNYFMFINVMPSTELSDHCCFVWNENGSML